MIPPDEWALSFLASCWRSSSGRLFDDCGNKSSLVPHADGLFWHENLPPGGVDDSPICELLLDSQKFNFTFPNCDIQTNDGKKWLLVPIL
jgi:hypothetical protein